jgi:hypothetical protein
MIEKLIYSQLYQLPETLKLEVLHYIQFLNKEKSVQHEKVAPKERVFGSAKGKYQLADDFDAPLEDFKDYM